jgi:hypothetical protein
MIKIEELFEKAKAHQEKFKDLNKNFWPSLWLVLEEIEYYGGADILFNGKVYKVRTKDDAIMLFLEIYDAYKTSIA